MLTGAAQVAAFLHTLFAFILTVAVIAGLQMSVRYLAAKARMCSLDVARRVALAGARVLRNPGLYILPVLSAVYIIVTFVSPALSPLMVIAAWATALCSLVLVAVLYMSFKKSILQRA